MNPELFDKKTGKGIVELGSPHRAPVLPKEIDSLIPDWVKQLIKDKIPTQKIRIQKLIEKKFNSFLLISDHDHNRSTDFFYYLLMIWGEWYPIKFTTQNLEWISNFHFLAPNLLGQNNIEFAQDLVKKFDWYLETGRRFLNSSLKGLFPNKKVLEGAILKDDYYGPLLILVDQTLQNQVRILADSEDFIDIYNDERMCDLRDLLVKNAVFEVDYYIERDNKPVKQSPYQLVKPENRLTFWSRLLLNGHHQIVRPSAKLSLQLSIHVLEDSELKKKEKRRMINDAIASLRTIESTQNFNKYSNFTAPLTKERVKHLNNIYKFWGKKPPKVDTVENLKVESSNVQVTKFASPDKPNSSKYYNVDGFRPAKKKRKTPVRKKSATPKKGGSLSGPLSNWVTQRPRRTRKLTPKMKESLEAEDLVVPSTKKAFSPRRKRKSTPKPAPPRKKVKTESVTSCSHSHVFVDTHTSPFLECRSSRQNRFRFCFKNLDIRHALFVEKM